MSEELMGGHRLTTGGDYAAEGVTPHRTASIQARRVEVSRVVADVTPSWVYCLGRIRENRPPTRWLRGRVREKRISYCKVGSSPEARTR